MKVTDRWKERDTGREQMGNGGRKEGRFKYILKNCILLKKAENERDHIMFLCDSSYLVIKEDFEKKKKPNI